MPGTVEGLVFPPRSGGDPSLSVLARARRDAFVVRRLKVCFGGENSNLLCKKMRLGGAFVQKEIGKWLI